MVERDERAAHYLKAPLQVATQKSCDATLNKLIHGSPRIAGLSSRTATKRFSAGCDRWAKSNSHFPAGRVPKLETPSNDFSWLVSSVGFHFYWHERITTFEARLPARAMELVGKGAAR